MADNATWPRQLVGYGPPHDQIYVLALHTMNILILIPARGGSKRLPGKHLRHLAGRSLMEWTARDISASGLDAPCLLTTDDEAIAEAGRKLGWIHRVPESVSECSWYAARISHERPKRRSGVSSIA